MRISAYDKLQFRNNGIKIIRASEKVGWQVILFCFRVVRVPGIGEIDRPVHRSANTTNTDLAYTGISSLNKMLQEFRLDGSLLALIRTRTPHTHTHTPSLADPYAPSQTYIHNKCWYVLIGKLTVLMLLITQQPKKVLSFL